MAPPFTILTTDHTGLCVSSLDDALPFWTELLGFEVLRSGEIGPGGFLANVCDVPDHGLRFVLMRGFGHQVELLEYTGPARAQVTPGASDIGAAHICFTLDDLDAALAAMAPYGWTAAGEPQILSAGPRAGTRVVYVSNADNLHLELMQPPR